MSWSQHDDRSAGRPPSLDEELRSALGGADAGFDYDALVAGTTARAARLRRRRALAQGLTAAVLVPTLVGTGWVVSNRLSVDPSGSPDIAVATQAEVAPDDAGSTAGDGAVVTEVVTVTAEPVPQTGPPFQDPATLPAPAQLQRNPDVPNLWDIPDPRPTGIAELDALGAPEAWAYPRLMPLLDFMASADNFGLDVDAGIEPHSGRSFDWYSGDPAGPAQSITLNVTAWDDSGLVMEQVRTGGTELGAVWIGEGTTESGMLVAGRPTPLEWAGHEGSPDHLLVAAPVGDSTGLADGSADPAGDDTDGPVIGGALVRQGDYLVGVTIRGGDVDTVTELAATIAEQTAANLATLDPEHGTG